MFHKNVYSCKESAIYNSGYTGYSWGGHYKFSKSNWEHEAFYEIFEHFGMKSCNYFSMGYIILQRNIEGAHNC